MIRANSFVIERAVDFMLILEGDNFWTPPLVPVSRSLPRGALFSRASF